MSVRAETLWEAKEARGRAWAQCTAGQITTTELYAILVDLRARFGQELYAR